MPFKELGQGPMGSSGKFRGHGNTWVRLSGPDVRQGPGSSGHLDAVSRRYRAMYQYRPQNEDELELREGDRVDVMQQCDDGWFVGMWARWVGRGARFEGVFEGPWGKI